MQADARVDETENSKTGNCELLRPRIQGWRYGSRYLKWVRTPSIIKNPFALERYEPLRGGSGSAYTPFLGNLGWTHSAGSRCGPRGVWDLLHVGNHRLFGPAELTGRSGTAERENKGTRIQHKGDAGAPRESRYCCHKYSPEEAGCLSLALPSPFKSQQLLQLAVAVQLKSGSQIRSRMLACRCSS